MKMEAYRRRRRRRHKHSHDTDYNNCSVGEHYDRALHVYLTGETIPVYERHRHDVTAKSFSGWWKDNGSKYLWQCNQLRIYIFEPLSVVNK